MDRSSIPSIPSISAASVPTDVKRAFDAQRTFFDSLQKEGMMTTADLVASGILLKDGSKPVNPQDVAAGTVPPAPERLTANGAFRTIILDWTNPPYKYFSHVEVWRSDADNINTALLVGTTTGSLYSDAPPVALTSKTYYYWVRIVSTAGVAGPWNATSGTAGHTADDPDYVLELLNQRIQAGQLHTSLSTPIAKIDGLEAAIQTQQSITSIATGPGWLPGAQYYKGKVVQYAGALYQATAAAPTVGIAPSSNLSQWKSVTNSLYGEYTVKIDINGYVAGFGLANDGVTSQFLVRADVFAVGAPGVSGRYPFVIDTGTNQVVMDNALIKNLTSTNIAAGTINADRINASSMSVAGWLKAGYLSVGQGIYSENFVDGVSGWGVDYLGGAQFNNVRVRGDVEADRLKANVAMVREAHLEDAIISTAKIKTAAITNAKIEDAAVNTLKIAGNSIWVPVYAKTVMDWAGATTKFATTASVDLQGGRAIILVHALLEIYDGTSVTLHHSTGETWTLGTAPVPEVPAWTYMTLIKSYYSDTLSPGYFWVEAPGAVRDIEISIAVMAGRR